MALAAATRGTLCPCCSPLGDTTRWQAHQGDPARDGGLHVGATRVPVALHVTHRT